MFSTKLVISLFFTPRGRNALPHVIEQWVFAHGLLAPALFSLSVFSIALAIKLTYGPALRAALIHVLPIAVNL